VRRLVAILLGVAVASTAGQASALHTHDYTDHDHPEHHHGLASHEHRRFQAHPDDAGPRLDACDPGRHSVSIVPGCCAALADQDPIAAVCGAPTPVRTLVRVHSAAGVTEVRVHGPPLPSPAAPRAPPRSLPV
jgi:hypothetical protein